MQDQDTVVKCQVPLAIKSLIRSNNQLLQQYQAKLLEEIEEANQQMMTILELSSAEGWRLDLDNQVYVRPKSADELKPEKAAPKK